MHTLGEMKKVTLSTIGKGAAEELFQNELQRVLENIDDPNMAAKEKRQITVTLTFVPSEARDFCTTAIEVKSKMAPVTPASTALILQRDGKKHVALEPAGKQASLFDAPKVHTLGGPKGGEP